MSASSAAECAHTHVALVVREIARADAMALHRHTGTPRAHRAYGAFICSPPTSMWPAASTPACSALRVLLGNELFLTFGCGGSRLVITRSTTGPAAADAPARPRQLESGPGRRARRQPRLARRRP